MCRLFLSQDPASYEAETRPIRLHGHCTSIRLEAAFWGILEEIASKEGSSVARFCATLHDEMTQRNGVVSNFASVLRVTCLHYCGIKTFTWRRLHRGRSSRPPDRSDGSRHRISEKRL